MAGRPRGQHADEGMKTMWKNCVDANANASVRIKFDGKDLPEI